MKASFQGFPFHRSRKEREKTRKRIVRATTGKEAKLTKSRNNASQKSVPTAIAKEEDGHRQNLLNSIFVHNKTRKPEELFTGAVH
jgi:hypothetical protein